MVLLLYRTVCSVLLYSTCNAVQCSAVQCSAGTVVCVIITTTIMCCELTATRLPHTLQSRDACNDTSVAAGARLTVHEHETQQAGQYGTVLELQVVAVTHCYSTVSECCTAGRTVCLALAVK